MAKFSANDLADRCQIELDRIWHESQAVTKKKSGIPAEINDAVIRSINSATKTYRYVLPTQILAKHVDSTLDCRSVQAGSNLPGSFDARSISQKVIVPFDRSNHNVLGGATEPYANNPLRIASIAIGYRNAQKNKLGFDDLCVVLDFLELNPNTAHELLVCVLRAIRDRLAVAQIVYPVPNRVSLQQTLHIVDEFLSLRTGGLRLQAVAVALFRNIGERFRLFESVESAAINASDASTGSVADLVCTNAEGIVVFAVEVKDRELEVRHIQDKLPAIREQGVRELLFVVSTESTDEALVELIGHEFVTGQNIYVAVFDRFLHSCSILFGEEGRRDFLIHVGRALDDIKADLVHRQTWRDLLSRL